MSCAGAAAADKISLICAEICGAVLGRPGLNLLQGTDRRFTFTSSKFMAGSCSMMMLPPESQPTAIATVWDCV